MVLGGDRAEMFVLVSKSTLDNLAGVTVSATTFPTPGEELRDTWTRQNQISSEWGQGRGPQARGSGLGWGFQSMLPVPLMAHEML